MWTTAISGLQVNPITGKQSEVAGLDWINIPLDVPKVHLVHQNDAFLDSLTLLTLWLVCLTLTASKKTDFFPSAFL